MDFWNLLSLLFKTCFLLCFWLVFLGSFEISKICLLTVFKSFDSLKGSLDSWRDHMIRSLVTKLAVCFGAISLFHKHVGPSLCAGSPATCIEGTDMYRTASVYPRCLQPHPVSHLFYPNIENHRMHPTSSISCG